MASDVSLGTTNTDYLSGTIKFSGLGSGTDFTSVVDQLVDIERINITRMETWKAEWEDKNTSISGLNTRMVSLKLNAKELDTSSEFYSKISTSSNSSVATTTNTSTAEIGTHTIEVGQNIPAQIISTSIAEGQAVGGAAGATMTITVGSEELVLTAGVYYLASDTIDELAAKIKTADDNRVGGPILGEVYVLNDKVRDDPAPGTQYKRLVLTAAVPSGGPSEDMSVSDPTDLSMDANTIDDVALKTWMFSSSTPTAGGTYTGTTNKTFTFAAENTGTLGSDDVRIHWADPDGNSGSFLIEASDWDPDKEYEIFQGLTVKFSAGEIARTESFTIDCFSPTYQQAQEKGLAQAEKEVHSGFGDLLTSVNEDADGYFAYRYEGVLTTIRITPGTNLQGLADAINSDPNNRGVTASMINDGQGTANPYHLVLTGNETGAAHSIEVVDPTTLDSPLNGLTNFSVAGEFETAQKATDSMIKLDGYPSTDYKYIQRMSNTVSDVIGGVVIDLHSVGATTLSVSNDSATIQAKVEQLVQSVNFVLDYIREETKYSEEEGETGVMIGNYTYDIVRNSINEMFSSSIPGLDREEDTFTHLSQIGISTNPDLDGQWVIDSNALQNALSQDMEAVAKLFIYDDGGANGEIMGVSRQLFDKLEELTDDTTGIANVLMDNYDNIIKNIDEKIAREERRVSLVRSRLEEKFARLETALGQLNGQSTYLESQLAQLPGNSSE